MWSVFWTALVTHSLAASGAAGLTMWWEGRARRKERWVAQGEGGDWSEEGKRKLVEAARQVMGEEWPFAADEEVRVEVDRPDSRGRSEIRFRRKE